MEFGNLLLDRLGFNREMLEDKISEISAKEKEIRVLKKEVFGIMEHISKIGKYVKSWRALLLRCLLLS